MADLIDQQLLDNNDILAKAFEETDNTINILSIAPKEEIELDMDDVELDDNICDEIIEHHVPLSPDLYTKPFNSLRRAKIMLFGNMLWYYKQFKCYKWLNQVNILKKIERACFNNTITISHEKNIVPSWRNQLFKDLYSSVCYKVSVNLEPGGLVGNPTLAKGVLNGTVSIKRLPCLSSIDMFPQKYTKILARMEASKNVKKTIKTTSMYICGRCHKNKCKLENLYNRSLDEGVNIKVTCVNCGHEFNA